MRIADIIFRIAAWRARAGDIADANGRVTLPDGRCQQRRMFDQSREVDCCEAILLYNVEQSKSSSHVVAEGHQVGKRALCKVVVYRDTANEVA
jgi:hypothetical protein